MRLARIPFAVAVLVAPALAQGNGAILCPADGAALAEGEVSVIAKAPGGRLELNGRPVTADEPFPGVLHATVTPAPGENVLALIWEGGRREIRFFSGANPPASYAAFRVHPPAEVACTQCHGVSRRGRFRFIGGCFDCHERESFPEPHQHAPHELESCGLCHNAHGSTQKALLTMPKEKACKQCHN